MLKKWMHLLLAASAATFLAACGGDDDDPPPPAPNIVGTAQADPRFSILVEAVTAADLATTLSQPGPITVFAPTNDAFAALLTELGVTKAQLLANKPLLTAVLKYHVLGTRVFRSQVPIGQAIAPSEGGIFKVEQVGSDLVITDGRNRNAKITATDISTSNGIIHVVDKVLLPADKNIVQTASALPQFSILAEAVVAADLANALSAPGPLTVFAPTNDAFAALLAELQVSKEALLADKPLLTSVLQFHVLGSRVLKSGVQLGKPITPLAGGIFKIDTVGGGLVITDGRNRNAKITGTDVFASNGVIHVIDKVILPADQTIVQTAQALPQFSILVEAVVAANLVDALSAPGPLTVFAPTNDAFAALLAELQITKQALLADTALLTKVLTYHVLPARVLKADVPVGAAITTLQTETFTVNAQLAITDRRSRTSNITATDVLTSNGVIHVIDKVILPAP